MITCPSCHHKELPGVLFCSQCGTNLTDIESVENSESTENTRRNSVSSLNGSSGSIRCSLLIIDTGEVVNLSTRNEFSLGRSVEFQPIMPDVDFTPYDGFSMGVSRLHASLRMFSGDVFLIDLGSSNGTRVNGQKIVPHVEYPVKNGDVIALGKLQVKLLISK
jgi:hypothetical protein